jgi:hypothetical protein
MRTTMDAPNQRRHMQWFVLFLVNLTIPVLLIWKFRLGEITERNAVISAAICVVGLNAAVLYGFRKGTQSSSDRLPPKFIAAAAMFALAGFSATALTVSHVAHHDSDLDLAMSDTPLDSIQPPRTRLIVELIRQTAANSRENDKVIAEARKHPLDPEVYSPQSFSSVDVMNRTVARLTAFVAADAEYYGKQQSAQRHFREQMAIVDPAYLESWNNSRSPQASADATTEEVQGEWLESVKALYDYAAGHYGELLIRDGKVQFSTPGTNVAFNDQMVRSKALHDKLLSAVQRGVGVHRQAREKFLVP